MRGGEPLLFHSRLSGPLNLHLLRPAEVVAAVLANPAGAPLNSVEGFVRQVIGWREFVRGLYWRFMPEYAARNVLAADLPVPRFYWTGETDMRLPRRGDRPHHRSRLRPPHRAADGAGALLPAAGRGAPGGAPLAHVDVLGRRRLGLAAQRPGHEPVGRRRPDRQQALRRLGRLHQSDERPLPAVPLRSAPERWARMPARSPPSTGISWRATSRACATTPACDRPISGSPGRIAASLPRSAAAPRS